MSEFYGPAQPRDLGDPATDPPLTVRVRAEPGDQHAPATTAHERGDLDVDAFRGGSTT